MRYTRLAAVLTALVVMKATPAFAGSLTGRVVLSPDDGSQPCGGAGQPSCSSDIEAPEPAVMALMASGLIGLAGMSLVRRRGKEEEGGADETK
jgi:hypothetical protein